MFALLQAHALNLKHQQMQFHHHLKHQG